jgi:hypothetical protein
MELIDINCVNIKKLLHYAHIRGYLHTCNFCGEHTLIKTSIPSFSSPDGVIPVEKCFNPECSTFKPLYYLDAEPCRICGVPNLFCVC